jgi:hypothetical protein
MVNGIQKGRLETCAPHPGGTSAFDISAQSNLTFGSSGHIQPICGLGGDAVDFEGPLLLCTYSNHGHHDIHF